MVLPFLCDGIQKARGIVIAIPPANCYNRNNKPGEGTCVDKLNFIWKDRKRILGMPISFTKYAINEIFCRRSIPLLLLLSVEVK